MGKELYFKNELNYIKNEFIKNDLIRLINLIPEYFFTIPASSTGKYHPKFAGGERGLLRHTKVAAKIAYDLLNLEMNKEVFNDKERDLIIYSIILHDSFKCGENYSTYSKFEHPLLAGHFVLKNSNLEDKELISNMIKSHMGQWNSSKYNYIILPTPKTNAEKFVHMCDFLSSKKYLNVNFRNGEIEEEMQIC